MPYTYRFLPSSDWHLLTPILECRGGRIPRPEDAQIVVCEADNHELIGFLIKQKIWHQEPLWYSPEVRGNDKRPDYLKMSEMLGQEGVYVFGTDERSEHMVQAAGMVRLPYSVWIKE